MGRGRAKDAYDLYFLVKHYHGGLDGLAKLFEDYRKSKIIVEMKEKLSEKFASPNHAVSAVCLLLVLSVEISQLLYGISAAFVTSDDNSSENSHRNWKRTS